MLGTATYTAKVMAAQGQGRVGLAALRLVKVAPLVEMVPVVLTVPIAVVVVVALAVLMAPDTEVAGAVHKGKPRTPTAILALTAETN